MLTSFPGLFAVTIRQALFIAPCSHTFHYKCIRPLLECHHPAFSCPLCRTFADLEEDVEVEVEAESGKDGDGGADADDESAPDVPGTAGGAVLADAVAALRPMTAVAVPPPPAIPYEHARHGLAVERADPGAETEVEVDRDVRRRDVVHPEVIVDMTDSGGGVLSGGEDEDEDMVDLTRGQAAHPAVVTVPGGLGVVYEAGSGISGVGEYEGGGGRSPGDGYVGGSEEMGGIFYVDGEVDADGTVGGKRKR